jgi:GcrA cell cycle regulator
MWTDAAIETLRQMALEGKSASTIAVALGAPSRNAVIGKANRIGVKLTGNIHGSAPRAPRSNADRPRRPAIARTESLGRRAIVPAVPRERKPAWLFAEAQVGEMLKVGFEEIREDADRRSDERRVCLLRHSDGEGPLLLRRPLPDGL